MSWCGELLPELGCPLVGLLFLGSGALRLLAERSRRKTLVAVTARAPAGTYLVQARGAGGPALWLRVGTPVLAPDTSPHQESR